MRNAEHAGAEKRDWKNVPSEKARQALQKSLGPVVQEIHEAPTTDQPHTVGEGPQSSGRWVRSLPTSDEQEPKIGRRDLGYDRRGNPKAIDLN